jgi:hypothetical protein
MKKIVKLNEAAFRKIVRKAANKVISEEFGEPLNDSNDLSALTDAMNNVRNARVQIANTYAVKHDNDDALSEVMDKLTEVEQILYDAYSEMN